MSPQEAGSRSSAPPAAASTGGVLPDQWPSQVADAIVDVVGKVRDRTTGPAITAARAVVYGLVAAVLGGIGLVLLCILTVRILANYIPGDVWTVYIGLGVLLTAAGLWSWSRAFAQAPADRH
ncbi:MAG: hypothetical protein JWN46_3544 [Acidimicrobiales bacterium]|nr:hypothetical protein [Acidimicrobiales bacterium]